MSGKARCWCFTWNNGPGSARAVEEVFSELHYRYLIFQLEKAGTGTLHWQGYVEWPRSMRRTRLSKLDKAIHWEQRRGSREEARHYCMKPVDDCGCEHCDECERVEGCYPHEYGEWDQRRGKRTDLDAVYADIREGKSMRELAELHPGPLIRYHNGIQRMYNMLAPPRKDPPIVTLLYGPPGCGKTRSVYDNHELVAIWTQAIGKGGWFDGYDRHAVALLDDFCGKMSHWQLVDFLRLVDRYPLKVPVKKDFVEWLPDRIILTTNIHPRQWWKWDDREQQWPALVRRFTSVVYWNDKSANGTWESGEVWRPDLEGRGPDDRCYDEEIWNKFWAWRPSTARSEPPLEPNVLYRAVAERTEPYGFMFG